MTCPFDVAEETRLLQRSISRKGARRSNQSLVAISSSIRTGPYAVAVREGFVGGVADGALRSVQFSRWRKTFLSRVASAVAPSSCCSNGRRPGLAGRKLALFHISAIDRWNFLPGFESRVDGTTSLRLRCDPQSPFFPRRNGSLMVAVSLAKKDFLLGLSAAISSTG